MTPVTWVRPTARAPFTLTGADGVEVRVPSGRTWVAFPPEGVTAIMDERAVKDLLGR